VRVLGTGLIIAGVALVNSGPALRRSLRRLAAAATG
jgi:hypothetical protein